MKEILHVHNACVEEELKDFCMSVYEGEIVYIQSDSYKSIHTLSEVLSGNKTLESGTISVYGREVDPSDSLETFHCGGIYNISYNQLLLNNMKVYENIHILFGKYKYFQIFHSKKIKEGNAEYLSSQNINIDLDAPVGSLEEMDRWKLSLILCRLCNAKLAVFEIAGDVILNEEMVEIIRRLHAEGISFLLLSTRYPSIADHADRVFYLSNGRDAKEWFGMDAELKKKLMEWKVTNVHLTSYNNPETKLFIGLFDTQFDGYRSIWEYLRLFHDQNKELYEKIIGCDLPKETESLRGDLVIIPRQSHTQLIETISARKNLTIAIEDRLTVGKTHIVSKRLEDKIINDFEQETGIDLSSEDIGILSRVERKILSIERFVLTRPKVLLLDNPYHSVHVQDIPVLRKYLVKLSKKGIKILYFSRSFLEMKEDCHTIIETESGKLRRIVQ